MITCEAGARDWRTLLALARLIPRICHRVNRVVYAWGPPLPGPVRAITPTLLVPEVLEQLRQVGRGDSLPVFQGAEPVRRGVTVSVRCRPTTLFPATSATRASPWP